MLLFRKYFQVNLDFFPGKPTSSYNLMRIYKGTFKRHFLDLALPLATYPTADEQRQRACLHAYLREQRASLMWRWNFWEKDAWQKILELKKLTSSVLFSTLFSFMRQRPSTCRACFFYILRFCLVVTVVKSMESLW